MPSGGKIGVTWVCNWDDPIGVLVKVRVQWQHNNNVCARLEHIMTLKKRGMAEVDRFAMAGQ